MRLIFELGPEGMDYLEIIISPKELANLPDQGIVKEFEKGFIVNRDLNVFIRVDNLQE